MKILLVISSSQDISYYQNVLLEIADEESIIILNSYNELNNFVHEELFVKQLELDIILLQNRIPNENATGNDFQRNLRFDFIHTYSNFDFNWRSVPIMLLLDSNENKDAYLETGLYEYEELIGFPNKLDLYLPEIIGKVKYWRRKLIDELSNLGIDYKNGNLDYSKFEFLKYYKPTNILSENYKTVRRGLNYSWLHINYSQIERSIDEFIREIKKAENSIRKDEKRFHKFFNRNPLFIKRDVYKQFWYEPKLHYHDDKFGRDHIAPDFALLPCLKKTTDLSLLEIKLPTEKFIKKNEFHQNPYSKFINHLFQVNDYKEYLESELYSNEVNKTLGFDPRKFEFKLLIGRKEFKEEFREVLDLRMKQMNMNFIQLITYDELMEYQVKFLERLHILEVK